jgi:hypothetical protein
VAFTETVPAVGDPTKRSHFLALLANTQWAKARLDRASALARLLVPIGDTTATDTTAATAVSVDGDDVTTAETTHYTVPSSGVAFALVQRITMTNSATVSRHVTLHLIASGGSRTVANAIWDDSLKPGETVIFGGPWTLGVSNTLRSISADAAANEVALRAEVLTYETAPSGLAYPIDQGDALTAATATYYTAPSGKRTTLLVVTICNTDTVARTVTVNLIPNGGSASAINRIFNDLVQAGETVTMDDPKIMDAGDFVQAMASAAAVVGFRITALEADLP